MTTASFFVKEQASARGDVAGYGQWWVKNNTPCEPWFTADDGSEGRLTKGFEWGDFTPWFMDSSLATGEGTYTTQDGWYVKCDNICTVSGYLKLSAYGGLTSTQILRIGNFPFTSRSNTHGSGNVGQYESVAGGIMAMSIYVEPGGTYCWPQWWDATTGPSNILVQDVGSTGGLWFSACYYV